MKTWPSDDRRKLVIAHRQRGLTPDRPMMRGTAQNPDVYFTGRETVNKYYNACPAIVQKTMDKFAKLTGRQYHLFDYFGSPDAEDIVVMMGSGAETVAATVEHLIAEGQKVGLVIVRLFRPFDCRRHGQCPAARPSRGSPFSTAPRSRAAPASPSIWMSSGRGRRGG